MGSLDARFWLLELLSVQLALLAGSGTEFAQCPLIVCSGTTMSLCVFGMTTTAGGPEARSAGRVTRKRP